MPLWSDANGFPEPGFPILANEMEQICMGTLYSIPLKANNLMLDIVGNNRLLGSLIISGALSGVGSLSMDGALSGATTIGASGLVTLSGATPLTITNPNAVITITGLNASLGTSLQRIRRGYFSDLEITNTPTVQGDPVALIGDLQRYVPYNNAQYDVNIGAKKLITSEIDLEVGATTRIFKDGSNNLSFTDAVAGTYTLAQLAATSPSEYLVRAVTQTAHGFTNDFVYHNGTIWTKAQADTAAKCATHYAERIGDNTFNLIPVGEVNVGSLLDENGDALVTGNYYFLSQTIAGKVTTLKPTNNIVQSLLKVNETGKVMISIQEPYDINDTGGGSMIYPGAGLVVSTGSAWNTSIVLGSSTTTFLRNDGTWATPAGSSVSYGTDNQIPVMNAAGTAFEYSDQCSWNGTVLTIYNTAYGNNYNNIVIGRGAVGGSLSSAYSNVIIGDTIAASFEAGDQNVLIGKMVASSGIDINYNVAIGSQSAQANLGDNSVFLGAYSGKYETSGSKLYIDSFDRTDIATGKTASLIYGEFNATPASQLIRFNSQVQLPLITGTGTGTSMLYFNRTTGAVTYGNSPFIKKDSSITGSLTQTTQSWVTEYTYDFNANTLNAGDVIELDFVATGTVADWGVMLEFGIDFYQILFGSGGGVNVTTDIKMRIILVTSDLIDVAISWIKSNGTADSIYIHNNAFDTTELNTLAITLSVDNGSVYIKSGVLKQY